MTKELNTGEPVAWMGKTRGEIIKCEDGRIYPFNAWSQSNIALYSQDYVDQLLGEIEALKAHLNAYQVAYNPKKHGAQE